MSRHAGFKDIERMLREEGVTAFRLVRFNCHPIYELDTPFGPRRLVFSATSSDWRAEAKRRSQVRRLLKTGTCT